MTPLAMSPPTAENKKAQSIAELLSMPGMEDIEFDPPRLGNDFVRPADFSEEVVSAAKPA